MLILGVIVGAALGGVLWAIEHFTSFYLVLLFPLVAGAILGGVLAFIVRSSKVRNPLIAGLVGIVAAVVMYGVYHVASYYVTFRGQVREFILEDSNETPSDEELDAIINAVLESEVGDTGFVGYLKLTAEEGISITRATASSSSSGLELKDELVWGYWVIEFLLAAGFAAWIAAKEARQPFDEEDNAWYGPPQFFAIAPAKARKDVLDALKNGDFQRAGTILTREDIKYPRLEIYMRQSATGGVGNKDVYLDIQHFQRKGRGNSIKTGVVSQADLALVKRVVEQGSSSASGSSPVSI